MQYNLMATLNKNKMARMLQKVKNPKIKKKKSFKLSFLWIIGALFLFLIVLHTPQISATWWNVSYDSRQEVNVTGGISTLTNFTVLLNVSYDSDMQTNFNDIRFVNGSCNGTQTDELKYEFDKKVNSNYALVWVKIPALSVGINKICMYYKNPTATLGEDSINAWDDYYKGVYHFTETSGTVTKDSKLNGNGSLVGNVAWNTTGFIGNSVLLSGTGFATTFINISNNSQARFTFPQGSLEALVVPSSIGTNYFGIMGSGNPSSEWYWAMGPSGNLRFGNDIVADQTTQILTLNKVSYASFSYSTNNFNVIINKTAFRRDDIVTSYATTNGLYIGNAFGVAGSNVNWLGGLDEIRISNISRSGVWLNRSYDNIDFNLFSFGTEEINSLPIITLNLPADNYLTTNTANTFNCSSNQFVNFTLSIDGTQNYSLNNSMYLQSTQTLSIANHTWTCYVININGTAVASSRNINITNFIVNSQTYNSSTYETAIESYSINISAGGSSTTANLVYNGTIYSATKSGNNYEMTFSKSLSIPLTTQSQNKSFYWNINYGGAITNSTPINQSVNSIYLALCNSTNNKSYINFTFKDESDLTSLNGTIPISNFTYWLGDGSIKKSFLFINNSVDNRNYAFCFSPNDKRLNVDYSINYIYTSYPQRISDPTAQVFTNVTTNTTLYLLSSSDGISDTTQVLTGSGESLSGVDVTVSRQISGVSTIIAQGTTGDDGTVSFWLNPDFLHTYVFTKSGYATQTRSSYPSTSGHTVTMGSSVAVNGTDLSIGISYTISPNIYQLKNDTAYTFNYVLSSNYWVVSEFGFNLKNSSGSVLNSSSASLNGGTVSADYNTGSLKEITMNYYYIANGSYVNFSKTWIVYDDESDNGWSIKTFFTDLQTYAGQNIFGLDNFGLTLIMFISMFIFVGIMSFKFGFTSPSSISLIIFFTLIFLSFGVNILPNTLGTGNSRFIIVFTGIIVIGMFFREWVR